jgi:hypothetical protein
VAGTYAPGGQNCSDKSTSEKRLVAREADGAQPGTGTGDGSGNRSAGVAWQAGGGTELVKVKLGGGGG